MNKEILQQVLLEITTILSWQAMVAEAKRPDDPNKTEKQINRSFKSRITEVRKKYNAIEDLIKQI
jgi:hypothetical protein